MSARATLPGALPDLDRIEDIGCILEGVRGIVGLLSGDLEHAATVGKDTVLATYGLERLVRTAHEQLSAYISDLYDFQRSQEGRA